MREIKFRGKPINLKNTGWDCNWLYGFLTPSGFPNYGHRFAISAGRIESWDDFLLYEVNHKTISQFTGLLDKNGKEIYEGDIIDLHVFNMIDGHDDHRKRYVIYKDLGFAIVNKWGDQVCEKRVTNDIVEYTVIGNIYDNPELLEGVKI